MSAATPLPDGIEPSVPDFVRTIRVSPSWAAKKYPLPDLVVEARFQRLDQLTSPFQVQGFAGGLVEVEEGAGQERVVVEEGVLLGDALGPAVQQPAVSPHLAPEELGRGDRGTYPARLAEHPTRVGQGTDHERIPTGQYLVVTRGRHAATAGFVEPLASVRESTRHVVWRPTEHRRRLLDGEGHVRDVLALEVALLGDVPIPAHQIDVGRLDHRSDLCRRPDEELPLFPLAVGIGGGEEAAVAVAHLPQQVVEGLRDDAAVRGVAGGLVELEVEAG